VGEFAVAVAAAAMRPVIEAAGRRAVVELLVLRVELVLEGPPAPGTAAEGGRERSIGAAGPVYGSESSRWSKRPEDGRVSRKESMGTEGMVEEMCFSC
jgi:hypothetical protein